MISTLVSTMDSVIPWINQLRPLEFVGLVSLAMWGSALACMIAIVAIRKHWTVR